MTPMAAVAPAPARSPIDDDLLLHRRGLPTHQCGQQTGDKEKDAIHDAKGPAGLEHGAGLVHAHAKSVDVRLAEDAEGQGVALAGERRAVVGADATQVVDASDESPDEAEVDEGDEVAVVPAAVVGEEGEDGPYSREYCDNEEDEDGGWGEQILGIVDVDEVGEHAKGGDEGNYLHEAPEGEEYSEQHGCGCEGARTAE